MTVRIALNRKGVSQVLRGDAAKADLRRRAEAMAADAGKDDGGEFVASAWVYGQRAHARVTTLDYHAMAGEAKDRRLTRAIDAGRR